MNQAGSPPVVSKKLPVIYVEADGFPSGQDTPEGTAADFARAFINFDVKLFKAICLPLRGGGTPNDAYSKFLHKKADELRAEAKKKAHSGMGPKTIAKLYAMKHMTDHGQASYAYAAFDLYDIAFVDVLVTRIDGTVSPLRTMVVQNKRGKWFVDPAPGLDPLLSGGLNEEAHSEIEFNHVYTVVPKPKP